jgi:hypothetical protein
MMDARPKITVMGEEVPWDHFPDAPAVELSDYFKPVKLSPLAINEASKIVPSKFWIEKGLYKWLQVRADHVFSKLPASQTKGMFGQLRYYFEFDADGPLLAKVQLCQKN